MSDRRCRSWAWITFALALPLASWIGCGQEESATGTEGAGVLVLETLRADQTVLQPGDSVRVAARVTTAQGQPVSGVTVRFGESGHPFGEPGAYAAGEFAPVSALTDSLGWAHSMFRSYGSRLGQVDLKAASGEGLEYLSLYLVPETSGGSGIRIAVSAPETSLPADGQSTVELSIDVTREGRPWANQTLYLAAGELFQDHDHDGAFGTGDRLLIDSDGDSSWDALGSVTTPVTTDGQGGATATYTAGYTEGDVFVKITADTVATDFQLLLHAETADIAVSANPVEVWADGYSSVDVSATVTDQEGVPLAGKMVRFTAGEPFVDTDGDGYFTPTIDSFTDIDENGSWDVRGSITSAATTTGDGHAAALFQAGRTPGPVTIYASTRESRGSAQVTLVALPRVATVETSWSEAWLYANGLSEATLTGTLYDINGSVIPGKEIALEATAGSVPAGVIADQEGSFSVTYRAPTDAGTDHLTLVAGDWEQDVAIEIRPLPELWTMGLAASPGTIVLLNAGGEDRALLQASCLTQAGESAPAGVPITFELAGGPGGGEGFESDGAASVTALTDAEGVAQAVLRSGSLPGAVHVTASRGALQRAIDLDISVGPPATITAQPDDAELGSWQQTTIRATVRDTYNNPVLDGTLLHFAVDEGLIQGDDGQAAARTSDGVATATYYSLSPEAGGDGQAEITVTAEPNGVAGNTSISIPRAEETIRLMTVEADPPELRVRGQVNEDHAVLRAACWLRSDVPAPAGIPVTFEIISGPGGGETLGEGSGPVTVETNAAGVAETALRSGSLSGPVHVKASAGEAEKHLYLGISAGPPAGVHCWPKFSLLAPGDTTQVFALIDDEHNNPVADGTVVYFTTDHGYVYTQNGTGTAQTVGGSVTAFYIAIAGDEIPPYANVTCATDGGVSGSAAIQLSSPEPPPEPGPIDRITLVPTRSEIGVQETGATEQCRIYAYCYDADNHPVGREREVTFRIVAGPNGGEGLNDQGWGPVIAYTDDTSRAHVVLSSGTISGTVLVEASAGSLAGEATQVSVAAGPPAHVSLGAFPWNIRGWDIVAAESQLTAVVSDVYHNPVSDGTSIYFTCDEGVVRGWDGNLGSSTTLGGIALATFLSGEPRNDGLVTITASTAGGTVTSSSHLITSGPPASVEFLYPVPPVSIMADGEDKLRFTVEVLDINGNYVLDGTEVEFYTTLGLITSAATTEDGVHGSLARGLLTSVTLGRDGSWSVPDDGVGGTAIVTAASGLAGSYSDVLEVDFLTGFAHRTSSSLTIENSMDAGTSQYFDVMIRDRYGNPLGGHALQASATNGATVTPSDTTDAWGTATMIFTAPAADTTCALTIYDADPVRGGIQLSETVAIN